MSGSRRGKLKEHCEGMHRNCDWIIEHCIQSMALIGGENPEMTEAFAQLGTLAGQVDEFVQTLYKQF